METEMNKTVVDVIKEFGNEKLYLDPDATYSKGPSLYREYLQWCFGNHEMPVGKKTFYAELHDLFRVRRDQANRWYGLVIRDDE